jgi:hypothetical protein
MIQTHPFSTWPLHVKLFTEEAVRYWDALTLSSPLFSAYQHLVLGEEAGHKSVGKNHATGDEFIQQQQQSQQLSSLLFPPGFTYLVELEGVDGSSKLRRKKGSGRKGPICITDGKSVLAGWFWELLLPLLCLYLVGFLAAHHWSVSPVYYPIFRSTVFLLAHLPWIRVPYFTLLRSS